MSPELYEYTFYQVADSVADVGVLLELQYDGRDDGEPVTLADNDLFAGIRLALNNTWRRLIGCPTASTRRRVSLRRVSRRSSGGRPRWLWNLFH